ncbi:S1 family peptidase [Conexibacter sp. CPCC 206217]|uniref:S1 family peptidase n=1 Tax=Conexibacter sp. CPCC 206217 TaxID=3064574 RepID=UPI0027163770|nr:S1 family peptidase [Conexibacter sp. CPCC 206217]MDO8210651.1 S1 family peptidase [Conexibacter sp. CPCC 206217]
MALTAPAGAAERSGVVSGAEREGLAAAIVRDFGVSERQALANVDVQARAGNVVEALQKALGDGYAGVWFDNDGGEFVVNAAAATDRDAVKATLARLGVATDARIATMDATWKELQQQAARWTERASDALPADQLMVGINAVTGTVNVTASERVGEAAVAGLREQARAVAPAVRVSTAPARVFEQRELTACSHPYCDAPLGGGVQINGSGGCTAGFLAFSNSDLAPYILTAGHCITAPANWWTYYANQVGWAYIGPNWNNAYDGRGDTGIVRITNAPWVSGGGMSAKLAAWTTGNGNYLIYGAGWSYFGQSLCHYGATNPRVCGTNDTAGWVNITAFGLGAQTYNSACSSHGDSGGPWAAANVGYGVQSSAYLCPSAGSWFTEAVAAAANMGVHVASAG